MPGTTLDAFLPPDDMSRDLSVANADAPGMRHVSVAGDTYTILLTGQDTAGRYCLIDMHVPPGGGPPPHRHDFEEMFTVLDGEIEVMFRGQTEMASAGATVNIPANAAHAFKNISEIPARLLCMCAPPGLDQFFLEIGDRVASRTAPPPEIGDKEREGRAAKAMALAARFRIELLTP